MHQRQLAPHCGLVCAATKLEVFRDKIAAARVISKRNYIWYAQRPSACTPRTLVG